MFLLSVMLPQMEAWIFYRRNYQSIAIILIGFEFAYIEMVCTDRSTVTTVWKNNWVGLNNLRWYKHHVLKEESLYRLTIENPVSRVSNRNKQSTSLCWLSRELRFWRASGNALFKSSNSSESTPRSLRVCEERLWAPGARKEFVGRKTSFQRIFTNSVSFSTVTTRESYIEMHLPSLRQSWIAMP